MRTRNKIYLACLLSTITLSGSTYAGSVNDKLNDLHKRLHNMEISEKNANANTQIHGVVEVEYGSTEDYAGESSSDIVLATVEIAIETKINNNVSAQISLLHEEDDTPLEIDVGIINIHDENSPVSVHLGQMYVPFGAFDSNMVSDPLTLELGETRESAIQINYDNNGIAAGFYIFNGDIEEGTDEDKVTKFGATLGYSNDNLTVGLDYISSISDTLVGSPVIAEVAGISAHATYSMESFSVIFEYLGAMDTYDNSEISYKGTGAQPISANVEFALDMPIAGNDSTIAFAYQTTDEALDLEQPETRIMFAVSSEIYESTSLAFEVFQDSDYDTASGGSDETANTFTVQLAVEF